MVKKEKRWIALGIILVIWFLAADAYWVSKDRDFHNCILENSTHLLKNDRISSLTDGNTIYWQECSWLIGAGNYWDTPSGMSYLEVIFLIPVMYRYRFHLWLR